MNAKGFCETIDEARALIAAARVNENLRHIRAVQGEHIILRDRAGNIHVWAIGGHVPKTYREVGRIPPATVDREAA